MSENIMHIEDVQRVLFKKYKDFSHYNPDDPFEQLLFIVCSTKTHEKNYLKTYKSLTKHVKDFKDIEFVLKRDMASLLALGGLQNKKASVIKNICKTLVEAFGEVTLEPLKNMSDLECETFLLSLNGVGKKTARCVMMYSLKRKVFPVDSHCWRISKRLGWIKPSCKNGTLNSLDMDRLQEIIPERFRLSLHVNMISFGRETCTPSNPKCSKCLISRYCKK